VAPLVIKVLWVGAASVNRGVKRDWSKLTPQVDASASPHVGFASSAIEGIIDATVLGVDGCRRPCLGQGLRSDSIR